MHKAYWKTKIQNAFPKRDEEGEIAKFEFRQRYYTIIPYTYTYTIAVATYAAN